VGLPLAHFRDVEGRYVFHACVGERDAREAARLDAYDSDILWDAACQIAIEQRFANAIVHDEQIARTSLP
jgi:hypothetical protein